MRLQYQTLSITNTAYGVRDLRVGLTRKLYQKGEHALSLRGLITLPLGSESKLSGSDKQDYAVELLYAQPLASRWYWHANMGIQRFGEDTYYAAPVKREAWYVSSGLHYQRAQWRWITQLDARSAVFVSSLPELGDASIVASFAGERQLTESSTVQLYFSEDIKVNRAADFAFGLSLAWRW